MFTNANFDQKEICKGISEVLKKNEWVGISAERQFNSDFKYDD